MVINLRPYQWSCFRGQKYERLNYAIWDKVTPLYCAEQLYSRTGLAQRLGLANVAHVQKNAEWRRVKGITLLRGVADKKVESFDKDPHRCQGILLHINYCVELSWWVLL